MYRLYIIAGPRRSAWMRSASSKQIIASKASASGLVSWISSNQPQQLWKIHRLEMTQTHFNRMIQSITKSSCFIGKSSINYCVNPIEIANQTNIHCSLPCCKTGAAHILAKLCIPCAKKRNDVGTPLLNPNHIWGWFLPPIYVDFGGWLSILGFPQK